MPELPEVETTLRGIEPYVTGQVLSNVVVRNASLRWAVPVDELQSLVGLTITKVERVAKYILLHLDERAVLLHLGMSGSLRVLGTDVAATKHDHLDLEFNRSQVVRLNDPRRFGCCLVVHKPIFEHKLLMSLGPEPLGDDFNGDYLFERSRRRNMPIKNFIMDAKVVVGVGNIYASESLFESGIRPTLAARRISRKRYQLLAIKIKSVLSKAIAAGGTTLSDFTQTDGKPGYFRHELQVYGRAGEVCNVCSSEIKSQIVGQRNTFYCSQCQCF